MGEEKRNLRQHTIRMTDRERIEIGGVTDVLRFDEEGVAVEGRMDALTYAENMGGGKQSFFAKLFR